MKLTQRKETAQGDALEENHKDDPKPHGLTTCGQTELERNIQRLDLNGSLEIKRGMMKRMKKFLTIVLATALFTGCATMGRKLDQTNIDKIKKGETTREEVLQLIGSPDQIMRDGDGNVTFMYMYVRATAKPEGFIPVVGVFAGGVDTQNQMFQVTFGEDGVVKNVLSTYGASEIGTGLSAGGKADLKEVETNKRPK